MQRSNAEQVSALLLDFCARLDRSLADVQTSEPPDVFDAYRDAVGQIMGTALIEVLNPIYTKYPDLQPPELK